MVLLAFAGGGGTVGLLFGLLIGYLLRRITFRWSLWLYALLVAASVWPFVLHFMDSLRYLDRSGVPPYAGLRQFMSIFPATTIAMVIAAVLLARISARTAALFPVCFGAVYWLFLIPLLHRSRPADYPGLDNVPFVWLYAWSIAATVFLATVAWMTFNRRRIFPAE